MNGAKPPLPTCIRGMKKYNVDTFTYRRISSGRRKRRLTLNLLTTTIVAPPSNARKLQVGFNLAFKGLITVDCKFWVTFT